MASTGSFRNRLGARSYSTGAFKNYMDAGKLPGSICVPRVRRFSAEQADSAKKLFQKTLSASLRSVSRESVLLEQVAECTG